MKKRNHQSSEYSLTLRQAKEEAASRFGMGTPRYVDFITGWISTKAKIIAGFGKTRDFRFGMGRRHLRRFM